MRVATFNLLHGRSVADGTVHPELLREAAAALRADVLGLQEVDRAQERSGRVDQAAMVAEAMQATTYRFVPALLGVPGSRTTWRAVDDDADDDGAAGDAVVGPAYGIALVSRLPVHRWAVRRFRPAPVGMPLLVPGRPGLTRVPDEPRAAVAAVLDAPRGPLTVVTAHLSFVPGWNVAQLSALARWARTFPGPRLLLGDFNLPGPLPRLASRWAQLARTPTYPSWRPRVQFDHVLGDGVGTDAVRDLAAPRLGVSDHCALVVDLDLDGG